MIKNNKKLGEIAVFINGYAFKPSQWSKTGLPIIKIAQITGSQKNTDFYNGPPLDKKLYLNKNDILFPWSGTIMVSKFKQNKGILNQHIFKVVPNEDIDKDFLYYVLEKNIEVLKNKSHGMGMVHINGSELKEIEVSIPELISEQKRIAKILTCVDNNIDITEQEIKKLEQIKIGIDETLFGNISEFVLLKDIVDVPITKGTTPSTEGFKMNDYDIVNFIKIDAIRDGEIPSKTKARISIECHKKLKRSQLQSNDILISIAGTLGSVVRINENNLPANTNQAFAIVRITNNKYRFVYDYLRSNFIQDYIRENTTKGAIPNLNLEQIGNIPIPVVPEKNIINIVEVLNNVNYKIKIMKLKKQKIEQLKKGLLNDLL